MINLEAEVLGFLEANSALVTLLGGKRIYQQIAPDPTEFPRITFFEMTNFDSQFADDTAIASEVHIQVDVWNKASTSAIAKEVDKSLKLQGWKRTGTANLYEKDTGIFHKAMRYATEKEL